MSLSIKSIFEFVASRCHERPTFSVLFVLKKRDDTWGDSDPGSYHSSGLLNSATFINQMLKAEGITSHLVQVVDGNDIDREVFRHNPSIVVLEALWCPPAKLRELTKLHHHRKRAWLVRNHSEFPFLATEGIALQWLIEYARIPNVYLSCNSPVANSELGFIIHSHTGLRREQVILLPNYYPIDQHTPREHRYNDTLDVGCFGAIRPLKNHVEQAIGACILGFKLKRRVRFHTNVTRVEGAGQPILKTLRAIFNGNPHAELVEHTWQSHARFLQLCRTLDLGMQVSFSETFNIVSADLVAQGVPTVTSQEVPWMPSLYCANPISADDIAAKGELALQPGALDDQHQALKNYVHQAKKIWLHQLTCLTS